MRYVGVAAMLAIAIAVVPSYADAQRVQPSLLRGPQVEQQRDTTPARRAPLINRLSVEQQIGIAGIVVASATLIMANRLRASEPVRSGFSIDQRYLVTTGAILGASVTAIWIERRKRDNRDAR